MDKCAVSLEPHITREARPALQRPPRKRRHHPGEKVAVPHPTTPSLTLRWPRVRPRSHYSGQQARRRAPGGCGGRYAPEHPGGPENAIKSGQRGRGGIAWTGITATKNPAAVAGLLGEQRSGLSGDAARLEIQRRADGPIRGRCRLRFEDADQRDHVGLGFLRLKRGDVDAVRK